MYKHTKVVVSYLIAMILTLQTAWADIVILTNGGQLEGKIIKETAESITLQVQYGEMEIPKYKIASIKRIEATLEEYAERSKKVPDTAKAHYELGKWCQEKKLTRQAENEFKRALEIDKNFKPAADALAEIEKIEKAKDDALQPQLRKEEKLPANFYILKRRHYVLGTDMGRAKTKKYLDKVEALYEVIKRKFFIEDYNKKPMRVLIFHKKEDFRMFLKKEGTETDAKDGGSYDLGKKRVYLFEQLKYLTIAETLFHEVTHQIFYERMMPDIHKASSWFEEGMAEYFQEAKYKNGKVTVGAVNRRTLRWFNNAVKDGRLVDIERLLKSKNLGKDFSSKETSAVYAQSWALFYYFVHSGDKDTYQKFLRYFGQEKLGKGSVEVFKKIFGKDLKKLELKVITYIKSLKRK